MRLGRVSLQQWSSQVSFRPKIVNRFAPATPAVPVTVTGHHLRHQNLWIIWEFRTYRFATLNLRISGLSTGSRWATLEVCVYVSK